MITRDRCRGPGRRRWEVYPGKDGLGVKGIRDRSMMPGQGSNVEMESVVTTLVKGNVDITTPVKSVKTKSIRIKLLKPIKLNPTVQVSTCKK